MDVSSNNGFYMGIGEKVLGSIACPMAAFAAKNDD